MAIKTGEMFSIRIENARENFIDSVVEQFGFSRQQAAVILAAYNEVGFLKLDPVMGRYNIKVGAAWDKDVMQNALATYATTS